jgi:acetyl-CoA carboxylase, biotin carboxylase subunit
MQHDAFRSGNFDTRFVENYFTPSVLQRTSAEDEEVIAALISATILENGKTKTEVSEKKQVSLWKKKRL